MWRSNTIAYGNVFYFINCIQMSTLKYNTIIDLSDKNVIYILLYFYCVCVINDEDLLKFVSIKSVGTAIFLILIFLVPLQIPDIFLFQSVLNIYILCSN